MNNKIKSIVLFPFNVISKFFPVFTIKCLFRIKQGYRLNLNHPTTYSEKIQWIKIHDHNPLMPVCCDKFAVRKYVEECGYGYMLNSLIWEGVHPEAIPFDELPEKYVVKASHGSTFNYIHDGSKEVDRRKVITQCNKWLKTEFIPCYGEWFYSSEASVPHRIIVEDFLDSEDGLNDYKIFVFNGHAEYILLCSGRDSGSHFEDVYDREWNYIPGVNMGYPCSGVIANQPECLSELISASEKLASPFYHARVDFYIVNNRPIFGEITFTSGSGFDRFSSLEFDKKIGSYLSLPQID